MIWVTSYARGTCESCQEPFKEGDKILLEGKAKFCESCGKEMEEECGPARETKRIPDRKKYNM